MCKNYFSFLLLVVVIAVAGTAVYANAETVLFSDNFNGADNGAADYGLNSDPLGTRHSDGGGAYAWAIRNTTPATMTAIQAQVNNTTIGGAGTLALQVPASTDNSYPSAIIQHDFATDLAAMTTGYESNSVSPYAGFTIRYDTDPMCLGTIGSNHNVGGGCGLGVLSGSGYVDSSSRGYYYEPSTNFVSTMSEGGVFNAFATPTGTSTVALLTNPASPVFDSTPPTGENHIEWYTCEIRVATSSFASGESATISFWVGPQGTASNLLTQVKIASDSMPGMFDGLSKTIAWDADGTCFIDFSAQGWSGSYVMQPTAFDNISVTAHGVPEPSTIALLATGLIGLLAYAWRKRN
ncbi:MAG: PEP-CTERM sorting domain-containing protein [Pirellulaceae bacterium]|nr:PEP-CTERM sorting domain-containing protein [Pirellulaceae bacterium]